MTSNPLSSNSAPNWNHEVQTHSGVGTEQPTFIISAGAQSHISPSNRLLAHNGMIFMYTPKAARALITNESSLCPLKCQSSHRPHRTFITLSPLQTLRSPHLRTTPHRLQFSSVKHSGKNHQLSGRPTYQSNATKAPSGLTFIPSNMPTSITSTSGDHWNRTQAGITHTKLILQAAPSQKQHSRCPVSSQEPSSVESRSRSNSIQSGQKKFPSSQAKHNSWQHKLSQALRSARSILLKSKDRPHNWKSGTAFKIPHLKSPAPPNPASDQTPFKTNTKQRLHVPKQSISCHNRTNSSHALDQQRTPNWTHSAQSETPGQARDRTASCQYSVKTSTSINADPNGKI